MKIFISWSGHTSKAVATILKSWVPQVFAGKVTTFLSSDDIQKGQRGLAVIASELDQNDFGLIVVTRDNQDSPWVNFEAGALGKSLINGRVAPLLVDLTPADVTGPLSQFQMTSLLERSDVFQLVRDINIGLDEPVLDESLGILFDARWDSLGTAVSEAASSNASGAAKTTRTDKSLLEEVLATVRAMHRNMSVSIDPASWEIDLPDRVQSTVSYIPSEQERRRRERNGVLTSVVSVILRGDRKSPGRVDFTFEVNDYGATTMTVQAGKGFPSLSDNQVAELRDLAIAEQLNIRIVGGATDVMFYANGGQIGP